MISKVLANPNHSMILHRLSNSWRWSHQICRIWRRFMENWGEQKGVWMTSLHLVTLCHWSLSLAYKRVSVEKTVERCLLDTFRHTG